MPGFDQLVITYGPVGALAIFFVWQWWQGKQNTPRHADPVKEADKPVTKGDMDVLRDELLKEIDLTRGAVYDVGAAVSTVHSVASEIRGLVTGMKR